MFPISDPFSNHLLLALSLLIRWNLFHPALSSLAKGTPGSYDDWSERDGSGEKLAD
ncbi:hypothetical protein ABID29_000676 [Streptococcus rupicaprae]|uniref:Uncharacterized protein n=1 Tax=Streptococcus rupicaprae TaxID=759619 RepID=A0ABV2FG86_9STRE